MTGEREANDKKRSMSSTSNRLVIEASVDSREEKGSGSVGHAAVGESANSAQGGVARSAGTSMCVGGCGRKMCHERERARSSG